MDADEQIDLDCDGGVVFGGGCLDPTNCAAKVITRGGASFSLENESGCDSVGRSDRSGVDGAVESEECGWELEVLPLHERLRLRNLEVSAAACGSHGRIVKVIIECLPPFLQ